MATNWVTRSTYVYQEKTELEEQRQALAKEVQSYRAKIAQLEADLLFRLSNSQATSCSLNCPYTEQPKTAREQT